MARSVAIVIIAGGCSKRFGENKLLLPFGGSTVIENVVETAIRSRPNRVIVITGYQKDKVISTLRNFDQLEFVHYDDYLLGDMGQAVQVGLHYLKGTSISGAAIMLADQPLLMPEMVHRVLETYLLGEYQIVAPYYANKRGPPVVIDRTFWPIIMGVTEPFKLRRLLDQYESKIKNIASPTDSILRDIDTPYLYQAALILWHPYSLLEKISPSIYEIS